MAVKYTHKTFTLQSQGHYFLSDLWCYHATKIIDVEKNNNSYFMKLF